MKKGSEYATGDMLVHGAYVEPILLIWHDERIRDDVFLVTGRSRDFLTIYVVKESMRMAPRLARFIPMALFSEMLALEDDLPKAPKRTLKKDKPRNVLEEVPEKAMPAPAPLPRVNRRRKPAEPAAEESPTPKKPMPTEEDQPPPRRRIQKRKRN